MGFLRGLAMVGAFVLACVPAFGQEDGGVSVDAGGHELLESIFVPYLPHAPFSLTLKTEWSRPMSNGGAYTEVNSRPIARDGAGRIYQERWLLSPKGSKIPSRMSWIQIADPLAMTLLECNARTKVCELETLSDKTALRLHPEALRSGALKSGRGNVTHEDLGKESFAGLSVQHYRDTTTFNAGTMGNDLPMALTREYRFSPELGLNLMSVVDTPQHGRQSFTVSEVATVEPEARLFATPEGYTVVDRRKPGPRSSALR